MVRSCKQLLPKVLEALKPSLPLVVHAITVNAVTVQLSCSKNISELQQRNKNMTTSTRNAKENGSSLKKEN